MTMRSFSKKKLAIIGAGGHGKVCAYVASNINNQLQGGNIWSEIVFIDDHKTGSVNGFKIISKDVNFIPENYEVFVAIGDNKARKELMNHYESLGFIIATLKDPHGIIADNTLIGKGTVVMPGAVISPNAVIGNGVIINTSSIIEHDCKISDYAHISPGAVLAGGVSIGECTWIGANSTILQKKIICNNVIIGAGATVTKDIDKHGIYKGFI